MKIKTINQREDHVDVYDIETPCHNYILENGVISHNTMEMFSKTVVSGGQGNILSPNAIIVVGRQKDTDTKTKELKGYKFILNIEKSRTVKDNRKIPLTVNFKGGILSLQSMLDICLEAELAVATGGPWYAWVDPETGEVLEEGGKFQRKATNQSEFWQDKFADAKFLEALRNYYQLETNLLNDDEEEDEDAESESECT